MKDYRLKQELLRTKADEAELDGLLKVASELKQADKPVLSDTTRNKIKALSGTPRRWPVITTWSLAGSMAVFLVLLISAQYAVPGSPLYWLKQGSEEVRAFIQPGFKEKIIDIRKQELDKLESLNASPDAIKQAEDAYQKALNESPNNSNPERHKDSNDSNRDTRDDRTDRSENNGRDNRNSDRNNNRRNNNRSDNSRSDSRNNNWNNWSNSNRR